MVLFDGVCNLCNASVNFMLDRDPSGRLRFASLQSATAVALLAAVHHAAPRGEPESVLLVENGRVYDRSTAGLRIARHLRGAWRLLYVFVVVPRPLRDLVYQFIARNRYRWFGRTEACRVPSPEVRARFLA